MGLKGTLLSLAAGASASAAVLIAGLTARLEDKGEGIRRALSLSGQGGEGSALPSRRRRPGFAEEKGVVLKPSRNLPVWPRPRPLGLPSALATLLPGQARRAILAVVTGLVFLLVARLAGAVGLLFPAAGALFAVAWWRKNQTAGARALKQRVALLARRLARSLASGANLHLALETAWEEEDDPGLRRALRELLESVRLLGALPEGVPLPARERGGLAGRAAGPPPFSLRRVLHSGEELARDPGSPLGVLVELLGLERELGPGLPRALESLAEGIEAELEAEAELSLATAEARASAMVVAVLPLLLVPVVRAVLPIRGEAHLGSLQGVAVFLGLSLDALGLLWVAGMVRWARAPLTKVGIGVSGAHPSALGWPFSRAGGDRPRQGVVLLWVAAGLVEAGVTPWKLVGHLAVFSGGSGLLGEAWARIRLGEELGRVREDVLKRSPRSPEAALFWAIRAGTGARVGAAGELRKQAASMVREATRAARERGKKVAVHLSFPLVFCFVPAFFLMVVVPVLVAGFSGVTW